MSVIEDRLNRVHRRKALLKVAKQVGQIDWEFTEVDDRCLHAAEGFEDAWVMVRVKVDRESLVNTEKTLRRMEKMREAKRNKSVK